MSSAFQTRRPRTAPAVLVALCSIALLGAVALPATAEPQVRYTLVDLHLTVSDHSVVATAKVAASPEVRVKHFGVCVTDAAGNDVSYRPAKRTVLPERGSRWTSSPKTFVDGTYTARACVETESSTTTVGDPTTFVVGPASSAPSSDPVPPPTTSPTTSPDPRPTASVSPAQSPSPGPSPSGTATGTASPAQSPSPTGTTPAQSPSPTGTAPAQSPSPTPGAPASSLPGSGENVLFNDDFDGVGTYDHSKWGEWSSCTYNPSAAYGKIGCGDRAVLDGRGHLVIPALPDLGTSISTKDHFSFTTGVLEARVLMQGNKTGPGYWPAVWTLNNNPDGKDAERLGEADLMEAYTGLAEYAHVSTHNYDTRTRSNAWSSAQDPACGRGEIFDRWVTVKAVLEPSRITFFYNGVQCGTAHLRSEQPGKPYGFAPDVARGNWPILTLAVGGAGGQQDGKAVLPGAFLVDYVRVTTLPR